MSEDIRISIDFLTHRKRRKLQRKLGTAGVLSAIDLWLSAARQRPLGTLTDYDVDDIEICANWEGEPGVFVEAMVEVGFLDYKNGIYSLHNWETRQGWVAETEARQDKARFSRLAQVNMSIYRQLKKEGVTSITKEEYLKYKKTPKTASEPPATASDSPGDRPATASDAPAPSPSPSPSPSPAYAIKETFVETPVSTPPCPHEKIREMYNNILPELPTCTVRNKTFDSNTRMRWAEDPARQNLDWWADLFTQIKKSDFLTGRTADFRASLDWIVKPSNMSKILNGNFENRNGGKRNGSPKNQHNYTGKDDRPSILPERDFIV